MARTRLLGVAILWLAIIAGAIALSTLAAFNDELPGDEAITDGVQDLAVPGQDLSDLIRTITETEVVLATGVAIALILWQRGYRRQAVLLGVGLILLGALQPVLKEIVDRPRPDPELVKRRSGFDSASFPSGHVMSATFLYGALLYFSIALPLSPVARLVMASGSLFLIAMTPLVSVWLGIHWPSDVAGSWLWCAVLLLPIVVIDRLEASDDEGDFPERLLG